MPAMLTSGNAFSGGQPGLRPPERTLFSGMASHSLWLRGTPLGTPSVREVQQIVRMSFASTRCSRSWRTIRSSSTVTGAASSIEITVSIEACRAEEALQARHAARLLDRGAQDPRDEHRLGQLERLDLEVFLRFEVREEAALGDAGLLGKGAEGEAREADAAGQCKRLAQNADLLCAFAFREGRGAVCHAGRVATTDRAFTQSPAGSSTIHNSSSAFQSAIIKETS